MGRNGIYGVCPASANSRWDGIYGQKWHLWRNMASMGPRHLQNALAQAAALTQPKWIG
jgi:hypothetical protein